jgi:hypothetical protein
VSDLRPSPNPRRSPGHGGEAGAGPRSPQHPGPGLAPSPKTQRGGGGPQPPGPCSLTYSGTQAVGGWDRQRPAAGCGRRNASDECPLGHRAAEVAAANSEKRPPARGGPGGGGAGAAPLIHAAGAG